MGSYKKIGLSHEMGLIDTPPLRNYSMFISGFHHQIMSGSLMRLNSRNFEVWPIFLFLNVVSALEGTLLHIVLARCLVSGQTGETPHSVGFILQQHPNINNTLKLIFLYF